MGSATFKPAASSDDGHWSSDVPEFNNNGTKCYFGNQALVGIYASFIRFPNVTIPKGSSIDLCVLKLYTYVYTGQVKFLVHYNDVGNAVAPTSIVEGEALSLTSSVAKGFDWGDNNPDIISGTEDILEAVVGRVDWSSGNAVMVILKDDESSYDGRFYAYDYNSAEHPAELYVEWTEPSTFKPIISTIF